MTPLVLAILPFAIVVGAFFVIRIWPAKQTDSLVARYRALGILVCVAAVVILSALILRYSMPGSAPTGRAIFFISFMLVFAIWQRRRLSRQLHKR